MHATSASTPSLIAAVYYLAVAAACLTAMLSARRLQSSPDKALFWLIAGAGMLGLSAVRYFALEDAWRSKLRQAMTNMELIDARVAFQAPAIVLILVLGVVLARRALVSTSAERWNGSELPLGVAKLAFAGLFVLLALRIVSLHAVDAILFTQFLGPVRLNWILDIGLSTLLAAAAIRYWLVSRNMP